VSRHDDPGVANARGERGGKEVPLGRPDRDDAPELGRYDNDAAAF
jgi:hypothetical protein